MHVLRTSARHDALRLKVVRTQDRQTAQLVLRSSVPQGRSALLRTLSPVSSGIARRLCEQMPFRTRCMLDGSRQRSMTTRWFTREPYTDDGTPSGRYPSSAPCRLVGGRGTSPVGRVRARRPVLRFWGSSVVEGGGCGMSGVADDWERPASDALRRVATCRLTENAVPRQRPA